MRPIPPAGEDVPADSPELVRGPGWIKTRVRTSRWVRSARKDPYGGARPIWVARRAGVLDFVPPVQRECSGRPIK